MATVTYGSMTTKEAMARAHWAARQALELDESAEAHTSMGVLRLRYDWEWDKAEEEFKRAIALDPEYPNAHFWYANLLVILRRPEEAAKESLIARDMDPYAPLAEMNYGRTLYYSGSLMMQKSIFKLCSSDPKTPAISKPTGIGPTPKEQPRGSNHYPGETTFAEAGNGRIVPGVCIWQSRQI
jgi:tetratricopeptide (TPR) repeat protein